MAHPIDALALRGLLCAGRARTERASSWDRTGANDDYVRIGPGETRALAEIEGAGCITRIYMAVAAPEPTDFRDAILRCYWDGEDAASVEAPVGDFFGLVHARVREYRSALTALHPGMGAGPGMSAYFPMPFGTHARIEIENRADTAFGGMLGCLWYHVDVERYEEPLPEGTLRFHAQYRQERPTTPAMEPVNTQLHGGVNLTGAENYVALEAQGRGHMVGIVLGIDNIAGGWYGEGDDMVFVDDDVWPPRIHGTGHEEVFGAGACVLKEYAGPYSGFPLVESPDYAGLVAMYRWYVPDPIRFERRIRWTIEHGHANNFANDYCSVAYWYQDEPHAPFPQLPSRDAMRPPLPEDFAEIRLEVLAAMAKLAGSAENFARMAPFADAYYRGEYRLARDRVRALRLD